MRPNIRRLKEKLQSGVSTAQRKEVEAGVKVANEILKQRGVDIDHANRDDALKIAEILNAQITVKHPEWDGKSMYCVKILGKEHHMDCHILSCACSCHKELVR